MAPLHKSVTVVLLGLALLGLLVSTTTSHNSSTRVGLIVPQTAIGEASKVGAHLAQEDFGEALIVQVRDSELDPERARTHAKELIEEHKVDALFSSNSHVTGAVSEVSIDAETPLFYDSCNCGFAEDNPYAFQSYYDPRKECRTVAEALKEAGEEKVAYFGIDVPYAHFCFSELTEVLGDDNVLVHVDGADTLVHPTGLLARAAAFGARVVVAVPAARDFATLFAANTAREEPLTIVCFAGVCLDDLRTTLADSAFEQVIGFTLGVQPSFTERIESRYPSFTHTQTLQAALVYDALAYTHEGTQTCSTSDTECFINAVHGADYTPQVAARGFNQDGFLDYDTQYLQIKQGNEIPVVLEEVLL